MSRQRDGNTYKRQYNLLLLELRKKYLVSYKDTIDINSNSFIGKKLKRLRLEKGLGQKSFGKYQNHVSSLEAGKIKNPTKKSLETFANILSISFEELVCNTTWKHILYDRNKPLIPCTVTCKTCSFTKTTSPSLLARYLLSEAKGFICPDCKKTDIGVKIKEKCLYCKSTILKFPHEIKRERHKFCDQKCSTAHRRSKLLPYPCDGLNCSDIVYLTKRKMNASKKHYCNQECTKVNKYNNCFGVVYKLTNLFNKKIYIGQTQRFEQRMHDHFVYRPYAPDHVKKSAISYAIRKYGWINFETEVLYEAANQEELNEKEMYFIEENKALLKEHGYNFMGRTKIFGHDYLKNKKLNKEKSSLKGRKQPVYTCHYCGKTGGQSAMVKYHFDNCLKKPGNDHFGSKARTVRRIGKNNKLYGGTHPKVTCNHCGKIGGKYTMQRWHFDNCKYKNYE